MIEDRRRPMKVIALLSWFDEAPSWLTTVVAGAARFCDAIVAVDGGYALYPGARPRSMPDQAEAIVQAAEAADLECVIQRPKDIWWGNEVQKRNATLALAGTLATPGQDWVCVMDGDMHLMKCNPEVVRWELENTKYDVATMTVQEGMDFLADPITKNEALTYELSHEWNSKCRLLYRYKPSLRYGPLHWSVGYQRTNQEPRWLWGPSDLNLAPAIDLLASLVCYHRPHERHYERQVAAKIYYETRDVHQVENRNLLYSKNGQLPE